MREAFNLCLGVDLLDSAGHTGSNAPDPSLTHDRALLRGRTGGASIRPLSHRAKRIISSKDNFVV